MPKEAKAPVPISLKISHEDKARLDEMMAAANTSNASQFIRDALFAPERARPQGDATAQTVEQLRGEIAGLREDKAWLQNQIGIKDMQIEASTKQLLVHAKEQNLLIDTKAAKPSLWRRLFGGREAPTVDTAADGGAADIPRPATG